ncbi:hypothetical protein NMS_1309 [Nonlabens marinus S1-08]|uniref:Uncharacterized protein n=1 Tax=Nonlabens marinus S1-08 TaxID=1454201 RepID=W8VVC3_9FLAO|nr:hypothetical protein NMS_1309 [Nonlabens marinus S1-08]
MISLSRKRNSQQLETTYHSLVMVGGFFLSSIHALTPIAFCIFISTALNTTPQGKQDIGSFEH